MSEESYIILHMMEQFLAEIEEYLASMAVAPSMFGRIALNDPGFVYRVRNGGECRPSTMDKVRAYMAANPPKATDRAAS